MEFDHLRGFFYVAKLGSFTEAAARLYLTQPAISHQVKALEREVGERLFDRTGRSIKLTHAGMALYDQVEDLIGRLDEIHHTVLELQRLERGRLSLGASDTLSMYFLPDLLRAFWQAHPKVELRITSEISPHVARKVIDRELDLGIITLPGPPSKLEVIPLFKQRLVCILWPEHPFAARKALEVHEVAAQPLILLEEGSVTRDRVVEYLALGNRASRPVMELSNFEIIKHYVAAGLGISLVPEGAVAPARDAVVAVPLRQPLSLEVGVVYRQDRKLSHPAQAFLALAQEHFRQPRRLPRACVGPQGN